MLDDGEPEARPAFQAAFGCVDLVEALGQARQVLGCDSRAVVAHGELDPSGPIVGRGAPSHAHLDPSAARAVLDRVLDQILHHAQDLVPVPEDRERTLVGFEGDRDAALPGEWPEGIDHVADEGKEVDRGRRRDVGAQLDTRQGEGAADQDDGIGDVGNERLGDGEALLARCRTGKAAGAFGAAAEEEAARGDAERRGPEKPAVEAIARRGDREEERRRKKSAPQGGGAPGAAVRLVSVHSVPHARRPESGDRARPRHEGRTRSEGFSARDEDRASSGRRAWRSGQALS
jgi:hypothetical protein